MFKEFKEFAVRGSVIDMAVGIIIGAAFGKIVNSLVTDIVMPPVGYLLGKVDLSNMFIILWDVAGAGPYHSLANAQAAGAVTLNIGMFLNSVVGFVIIAFSVFLLVKAVNRVRVAIEAGPAAKECPFCLSQINAYATRCPQCTSNVA